MTPVFKPLQEEVTWDEAKGRCEELRMQLFFPDNCFKNNCSDIIEVQQASLGGFWVGLRRVSDKWWGIVNGDELEEATIPFTTDINPVTVQGFEAMFILEKLLFLAL